MAWHYRPQLDGMRTLAVYLVVLFHAGIAVAGGAFIGVDLFFVLSGFLVSNVILNEYDGQGRFGLGRFYARRVRRLLPAAVAVIVITCLLQLLTVPAPSRFGMVHDARSALLYFANWQFIADAQDYFGDGQAPSPFLHFWSLSIEEQFYVFFPVLLWFVLVRLRRSERVLGSVLAVALVASVIAQVVTAHHNINHAYYGTHTRIYQLLAGALLALALRRRARLRGEDSPAPDRGAGLAWSALGVVGVVAIILLATDRIDLTQSNRGLLTTIASVAAIAGVTLAPRSLLSRVTGSPLPRYLGQISYGTYLWHWPVILLLRSVMPMSSYLIALVAAAIATGLASLSFQVFETPIRRARSLDRFAWPVVAAGLTVSVVAAAAVVAPVLNNKTRPLVAAAAHAGPAGNPQLGRGLAWTADPVPADLPLADLKNDEGDTGASCAAGTPASCMVVDGPSTEPLVVLVGDSHGGMLEPAFAQLARDHHFRLATNVRNKCAWVRGIYNATDSQSNIAACKAMRDTFYDKILPAMKPDLVVLTQRARDGAHQLLHDIRADDPKPGESFHAMLQRKVDETLPQITATGARALIIHSIQGTGGWAVTGFDPLDCLAVAKTLGECAVAPAMPPGLDSLYDAAATDLPHVYAAQLRDAYCPDQVLCAPVVDGIVTWKDHAHLSEAFTDHIRGAMWRDLEASGALRGLDLR